MHTVVEQCMVYHWSEAELVWDLDSGADSRCRQRGAREKKRWGRQPEADAAGESAPEGQGGTCQADAAA